MRDGFTSVPNRVNGLVTTLEIPGNQVFRGGFTHQPRISRMTTPRNAPGRVVVPSVCRPAASPPTEWVLVRLSWTCCPRWAWNSRLLSPRVQSRPPRSRQYLPPPPRPRRAA